MFRGGLEPWHIIVILVVLLLLFGGKRMPDAARSLGRSMRILKAETKGLAHDDDEDKGDKVPGDKADPAARSADIPQPLPPGRVAAPQDAPTPTPATTPVSSSDASRDQR